MREQRRDRVIDEHASEPENDRGWRPQVEVYVQTLGQNADRSIRRVKNPACVTTSQTWLRSRYCMNRTLAPSEKPVTIAKKCSRYHT